jgi:hypothetical protein
MNVPEEKSAAASLGAALFWGMRRNDLRVNSVFGFDFPPSRLKLVPNMPA